MLIERNGFYIWQKGQAHAKLSKHFMPGEFECHCPTNCGEQRISVELIRLLEEAREAFGGPIRITSAYRCDVRQMQLRQLGLPTVAVGQTSQHELGQAADIQAKEMALLEAILSNRFKAMGVSKRFIHVDMRDDKQRRWEYAK